MKKVISINFQGQVIAIEETAFEILTQYVESLKSYFSHEEGGDEIVNDIENRIAELFGNRLKHGINCLTDEDVEAIINGIGKPEDFDTEYEAPARVVDREGGQTDFSSDLSKDPLQEKKQSRSLRRDANNKMIAGVCSGLAHFFRIDPTWIRLIFVLFFSVLFWVYIVLWIVLKAEPLDWSGIKRLYRNPADRVLGGVCGGLAAYFKIDSWIPRLIFLIPFLLNFMVISPIPFFIWDKLFHIPHVDWNIKINGGILLVYIVLWIITPKATTVKQKLEMMGEEEYIKSIRETVSDNVASAKNKAESKAENKAENKAEDLSKGNLSESSDVASAERSGCMNVLILLCKIVFFGVLGFFFLILAAVVAGFVFAGIKLMPLKLLFIDPGYETILLWISLILVVAIPVVAIVTWIVRRIMKAKFRPLIGVFALILWILGIVMAGALAMRVGEKFNVTGFSYPFVQRDSLLLLPEFFSVPIEQGYRNQRLSIEIAMPTGKTVEIDKSFNAYLKDVPLY